MAPKKKVVEDLRSPLEISIANTMEQIKQCEAQVTQFREGVHDLATHTSRIKTLEAEIVPKEGELKQIMHAFNKLLENSVTITKMRGISESETAVPAPSHLPGTRQLSRATSRTGVNSPPLTTGPTAAVSQEETSDKEAMKNLSNVMRDCLTALITPLFMQDRTTLEQLTEEAKDKEALEAAQAAVALANPGSVPATPQTTVRPPAAPAAGKPGQPLAAGGKGASDPQVVKAPTLAELLERVDFELYRPPGLDPHVTADVLKLRQQRLTAERQLKTLQQQLQHSRQLVARRTNEGASKAALKKVEKNVQFLQMTLKDLERQREDQDRSRKSMDVNVGGNSAAAKGAAAKAVAASTAAASPAPTQPIAGSRK